MQTFFFHLLVGLATGVAANANDTPVHSQDSVADHHPASDQSGTVRILVQQFGAVGDGVHDDGPALRRVFAEASQRAEPTVIVFEKEKTYCVAPYAEANGRLMLYEATNVTVDGNGAMLLVHTPNRALGIYRSSNIVVRNLQIDYRNGWVTLARDLPDLKIGDSLYLNAVGTALIEGCQFGTQLQRAISFVCPSKDYDPMGSPHFVCIDTVFNLGAHAQPFHIVNAQDERIHNNHHRLITE